MLHPRTADPAPIPSLIEVRREIDDIDDRLLALLDARFAAVARVRAAKLSMLQWAAFLERHARIKGEFELEVMRLMSEVMAHTITLHLLDAPGRVQRFMRKNTELGERLPKKELASYLNLSPETLSRLKRRGKI